MKELLLLAGFVLQGLGLAGIFLTRKFSSVRMWPPPSLWSWQSVVVRVGYFCLSAIALALGWLDYGSLEYFTGYGFYAGLILMAFGSLILWRGIKDIGWDDFVGTGNKLQTKGIYQHSRNPQYLGQILLILGYILITKSWYVLVLGTGTIICFLYVPFVEEDYLEEEFGENYTKYREDVPRFF